MTNQQRNGQYNQNRTGTNNWNNSASRWSREQQQQYFQQNSNQYRQNYNNWQSREAERQRELQNQRRSNYLRYQQNYWNRLRYDQQRLQNFQYYDNYVNNYRYYRGGQSYYTSQYGASMLQRAVQDGYEQGFEAGQADRADNWQFDYSSADAYQSGAYGYDAPYVSYDEYNYYFRQGFQRGYDDGYYGRYQYGSYSNGKAAILANILGAILSFAIN
jgi:hypothetical protein